MCRLLGVASVLPTSVADTVGDTVLTDFLALTKIHGDGWGVASVLDADDVPRVEVSADSALEDPRFGTATKEVARGSVVHLRWATNGLAVQPENSHPFAADGVAMAHNGSIKPVGALEALLGPSVASTLRGTTDSERYFALLRQHRAAAPDLVEAVRRAVAELRHLYPDASLNALLLGEGQLIAVHAHARSRLLDEDIEEISATDLPAEHLEDYFSLRIARPDENTVVIGSTGFGDLKWSPLPAESVASVSLADLSVTVVPIMAD
ncbi:putative glutamine amidotransferase [Mycobacterium sp. BK558]|nr:putative glutamine amidotransferase [Mycobacterium sp. BK558]